MIKIQSVFIKLWWQHSPHIDESWRKIIKERCFVSQFIIAFNAIFPHWIVNHLPFCPFTHSNHFWSQGKTQLEKMWTWWVYSAWNKEAFVPYAPGNLKYNAPILLCHETFSQLSPWFMTAEPTIRPEAFKHDIWNRGCAGICEPCCVLWLSPAI